MISKLIEFIVATFISIAAASMCYYPFFDLWDNTTLAMEGKIIASVIVFVLIFGLIILLIQSVKLLIGIKSMENAPRTRLTKEKIKNALVNAPILGKQLIRPVYQEYDKFERIDFQNLLAIEFNRVVNQRTYIKYSVSIMITLGILGTFLGLIDAVQQSSNLLDSVGNLESSQDMAKKFKAPFSGMNSAFNTSILGIIGSITLGFYNSVASKLQQHLFIELEKYFELYLMPAFYPKSGSVQEQILDKIQTINQQSVELYKKIKSDIAGFLKETRKEQQLIMEYSGEMRNKIDAIQQEFQSETNHLTKVFEVHLNLSYQRFRQESKRHHETYLIEVGHLAKALDISNKASAKNIDNYNQKNSTHLSNIKTDFESKTLDLQKKINSTVKSLKEEHNKSIAKLYKDFRLDLVEVTKTIGKTLENQTLNLEDIISNSIKNNDAHLKQLFDHTQVNAENLAQSFKQKTQDYVEGITTRFQTVSDELFGGINQNAKQFKKIQDEILEQLQNDTKLLKQENKAILGAYKKRTDEYIAKTQEFQKTYEDYVKLISQSNTILNKTNVSFKALHDSYDSHAGKVAEYHQQIIQLTNDHDQNSKFVQEETRKLMTSFVEMGQFFEGLREEEAKISATFNLLFDIVSKNLNSDPYEENGYR